jgi:hypothetical protein
VIHSQSGVRKTLAHNLIAMGVGHGSIRRASTEHVDVMIFLPSDPLTSLYDIAEYFGVNQAYCKKTILLRNTTILKLASCPLFTISSKLLSDKGNTLT